MNMQRKKTKKPFEIVRNIISNYYRTHIYSRKDIKKIRELTQNRKLNTMNLYIRKVNNKQLVINFENHENITRYLFFFFFF